MSRALTAVGLSRRKLCVYWSRLTSACLVTEHIQQWLLEVYLLSCLSDELAICPTPCLAADLTNSAFLPCTGAARML